MKKHYTIGSLILLLFCSSCVNSESRSANSDFNPYLTYLENLEEGYDFDLDDTADMVLIVGEDGCGSCINEVLDYTMLMQTDESLNSWKVIYSCITPGCQRLKQLYPKFKKISHLNDEGVASKKGLVDHNPVLITYSGSEIVSVNELDLDFKEQFKLVKIGE